MGNPTLYWAGKETDLSPEGGIQDITKAGRVWEGSRVFTGAGLTTISKVYDRLVIKKGPFFEQDLAQELRSFWGWAGQGRLFGFALDSDDVVDTVLSNDPLYLDLIREAFDVWSGSPLVPEGWTVLEPGTSTVTREHQREDVSLGIYACKLTTDGVPNQASIEITTASVPSGASLVLSYVTKASNSDGLEIQIQNDTTSNYLQDAGTWAAGVNEVHSDGGGAAEGGVTMLPEYQRVTHSFDNDSSAGTLTIRIQSPVTLNIESWIDDIRLYRDSALITPRIGTAGFLVDTYYRLLSRTQHYEERAKVASIFAPNITLSAAPTLQFEARDILRSEWYYPYLQADTAGPVFWTLPNGNHMLELSCRTVNTGRS
jgi:hypothetical protein